MSNEVETFIQIADLSLIEAVQSMCRAKFPRTVKAFDALTPADIGAIKRGGLRSLPKTRLTPLAEAMEKDDFIFSN